MFRFVAFSTLSHRWVAIRPHRRRLDRIRVHLRRFGRRALRVAGIVLQHVLLAPVILAMLIVCGAAHLVAAALATREPALGR